MTYDLWYWDGIPGRGEFVRLALEAGKIPYRERARERGSSITADMDEDRDHPPFAPPYLVADGMTIAQTANILLFLGEKHGLAPKNDTGRFWVHQLQLTIADLVVEAHDVHHPIASSLYYEDQMPESLRRAENFRSERMPKFLDYFETALDRNGPWLAGGGRWTYVDLSLFHIVEALRFAFPKRMATLEHRFGKVVALHDAVAASPELGDYLSSKRRLAFGDGIFRHYPELDAA